MEKVSSHVSTRSWTCETLLAKNAAPPRNMLAPTLTSDRRPVATYTSARKPPKNISELPRSRMTISISIASPQTSSSGPKCLSDGRSRITATSDATNTTSRIVASRLGWKTRIASSVSTVGIP